jgi:hypothetical protein
VVACKGTWRFPPHPELDNHAMGLKYVSGCGKKESFNRTGWECVAFVANRLLRGGQLTLSHQWPLWRPEPSLIPDYRVPAVGQKLPVLVTSELLVQR